MSLFGMLFGLFNVGLYIILFGFTIYIYVLIVKLSRRGIKALDLYIDGKNNRYID